MRKLLLVSTVAATALISAPFVAAQDEATGVVAYRQATMKSFGAHLGAVKVIIQEEPELIEQAGLHAQAIEGLAIVIPAMFPDGSEGPKSAALPAIWEDQAGFEAAANDMAEKAAALGEAAANGDVQAVMEAYATLGRDGCNGCHDNYRAKKN